MARLSLLSSWAARYHSDLLDLYKANPLVRPGALTVMDVPIDLSSVKTDFYVLAGVTDHITPWKACYSSSLLLGGNTEFVLSNSGHVQSILNPPGNPKASYFTNPQRPADANTWLAQAEKHTGSWWDHWQTWLTARSGRCKPAPEAVGSRNYPPLCDAPGTYVYD